MVIISDSRYISDVALFHVKSNAEQAIPVATHIHPHASFLNSMNPYILVNPTSVVIWNGEGSTEVEMKVATEVAALLATNYNMINNKPQKRKVINIEEGKESAAFWKDLGGNNTYTPCFSMDPRHRFGRVFEAAITTGSFKVSEIPRFIQQDFRQNNVYILDVFTHLFLWYGAAAGEEVRVIC